MQRRGFLAGVAASLATTPVLGQVGYWRGTAYSGRVCSDSSCRMCNSIQRQIEVQQQRYVPQNVRTVQAPPPPPNLEAIDKYEPASMAAVKAVIDLYPPKPGDRVVDFAGGDGRMVTTALVQQPDALGTVIEINPSTAKLANQRVASLGLDRRIAVTNADARDFNYKAFDVCYLYAFSDLINRLIRDDKLVLATTAVVSLNHDFEGSELVYHRGFPIHVSLPS